jgi:hypothetical protein
MGFNENRAAPVHRRKLYSAMRIFMHVGNTQNNPQSEASRGLQVHTDTYSMLNSTFVVECMQLNQG